MASYMVARHLLWKWIPAPYCLRGKLSIFLYFVVSFHLLELLDRSGRYLLLWVLHKSVPMSSSPSQSMGFIQLTWTAMDSHGCPCPICTVTQVATHLRTIQVSSNRATSNYSCSDVCLESHCCATLDPAPRYCREDVPRKQVELTWKACEVHSAARQGYL